MTDELPLECKTLIGTTMRKSKKQLNRYWRTVQRNWMTSATFQNQVQQQYQLMYGHDDAVNTISHSHQSDNVENGKNIYSRHQPNNINATIPGSSSHEHDETPKISKLSHQGDDAENIKHTISSDQLENTKTTDPGNSNREREQVVDTTMGTVKRTSHLKHTPHRLKRHTTPRSKLVRNRRNRSKNFAKNIKKIVLPRRIRQKLFRKNLLRKILGAQQTDSELKKTEAMQTAAKSSCKKSTNKQNLYCVCQTPDHGMYIQCETCNTWLHPSCVFNKNHLGFSLTKEQWRLCRFACLDKKDEIDVQNSKPVLYHKALRFKNKPYCSPVSIKSKENNKKPKMLKIASRLKYLLPTPAKNDNKPSNLNLSYKIDSDSKTENIMTQNQNANSNSTNGSCSNSKNTPFTQQAKSPDIDSSINITNEYSNLQRQTPKNINRKNNLKNTFSENDDETIENKNFKTTSSSQTSHVNAKQDLVFSINTHSAAFDTFDGNKNLKDSKSDLNTSGMTYQTLEQLGSFKQSITDKELKRMETVDLKAKVIRISLQEWMKMTSNRSDNHFKNESYIEILLPKFRAVYSACVPCVGNNYLRKRSKVLTIQSSDERYYEGYVSIYCKHATCDCKCEVKGRINFYSYYDRIEAVTDISGKRSHLKSCLKSRRVTGSQRKEIIDKLQNNRPYSVYRDLQLSLTEEERVYGSNTYAPSHAVLRSIKSRDSLASRYSDSWIINTNQLEKSFSEQHESFIRDVKFSFDSGPEVIMFSDAQIKLYGETCRRDILYLDATGSVMKKYAGKKDFQIYTLLVRHPLQGGTALPVATNLTTRHDALSISSFLDFFLKAVTKIIGSKSKPIMIMIDGSMAMWNAVLRSFADETRFAYYSRCWRIITGRASQSDLNKTFVLNCYSHAMRAAKCLVTKYYQKQYKKEAMYWIALLFSSTTLEELECVMKSLIVVLTCENTSQLVKDNFEKLQEKVLECDGLPIWNDDDVEEEIQYDHDLDITIASDKKQEQNSPFYKHFEEMLKAFLLSKTYNSHRNLPDEENNCENVYLSKTFCEKILHVIIGRICTTSQLMLGDLSRHYSYEKDFSKEKENRVLAYQNYSKHYQKLANCNVKTICINNRTQGIIEQHFSTVKNIYFKNKRMSRVEEFIEKYQAELMKSRIEFANFALRGENKHVRPLIQSQSVVDSNLPKAPRIVESKFRKGRKRRNTGFYSSLSMQKRIKFVGALPTNSTQHQNTAENKLNTIDQSVCSKFTNKTHFPSNFVFPATSDFFPNQIFGIDFNSIQKSKVDSFAQALWNSLPCQKRNITDWALISETDKGLTWLDLLSLNPEPSDFQFTLMKAEFYHVGRGWLSKAVVEAYLAKIVKKANLIIKREHFGCLDCDDFKVIAEGKTVKDKSSFCRKILEIDVRQLRANVFIPCLVNKHFVLLWYCKKTNIIKVIDSIQQKTSPVMTCLGAVAKFLKCFVDVEIELPKQATCFVNQLDSKSCGVCVCIAAEMICKAEIGDHNIHKISVPVICEYRSITVYELFATSKLVDVLVNEIAISLNSNKTFGIPNLGNTCWFNAIMQSMAGVLRNANKSLSDLTLNKPLLVNDTLFACLVEIFSGKIENENLLKEAVQSACNICDFKQGFQNDPEEFYRLANLRSIFCCCGLSCSVQFQSCYRCSSCNSISNDSLSDGQFDLVLPMHNFVANGDTLQKLLDTYIHRVEVRHCKFCDLSLQHSSRKVFQDLPQVLVLCQSNLC